MITALCLLLVAGILINALITGFSTLNVIYFVLALIVLIAHIPFIKGKLAPEDKRKRGRVIYAVLYGVFILCVILSGIFLNPYKAEGEYYSSIDKISQLISDQKYQKAERELQELYNKDNYDVNVLLQFGLLYMQQERIEDAWNYLNSAGRIMPNDLDVLYNMAINRYMYGKKNDSPRAKEEALGYLEKMIRITPRLFEAQLYAGEICLELGNYKKSEYYLSNSLKIEPKSPYVFYVLAKVKLDLMELEEVAKYLKAAKELEPAPELLAEINRLEQEVNKYTSGGDGV